jgi:hypothetical protein
VAVGQVGKTPPPLTEQAGSFVLGESGVPG